MVQSAQRALHHDLVTTLHTVKESGAATWCLVALKLRVRGLRRCWARERKDRCYHLSLTQPSRLTQGIGPSLFTSLFQGFTAVAEVGIVVILVDRSLRQAHSTAFDLELLSYALLALTGLVLILVNMHRITKRALNHSRGQLAHSGDKHHAASHASPNVYCGHHHGPSHGQLDAPMSWRSIAGMTFAIGIRPCSGAILVLLAAWALQLPWTGVGAELAMPLGTAITVSILAILSVFARRHAERLAQRMLGTRTQLALVIDFVVLTGGLTILAAGVLLLQATWGLPAHPLL